MPSDVAPGSVGALHELSNKATTAQSTVENTSVNRRLREALSRSPSPSFDDRRRSIGTRRDRSRSPSRASHNQWDGPRGEKRRRDVGHDQYGARNSKRQAQIVNNGRLPQREDRRAAYGSTISPFVGRADHDRRHEQSQPVPSYRGHSDDRPGMRHGQNSRPEHNRNFGPASERAAGEGHNDYSVSERAYPARGSRKDAESSVKSVAQTPRVRFLEDGFKQYVTLSSSWEFQWEFH